MGSGCKTEQGQSEYSGRLSTLCAHSVQKDYPRVSHWLETKTKCTEAQNHDRLFDLHDRTRIHGNILVTSNTQKELWVLLYRESEKPHRGPTV